MTVTLEQPPPPPAPIPPGWEGLLDPGEVILWQGQPSARLRFGFAEIGAVIFGLFFAGFALFWMIMAAMAGGFFWMFGLIHFSVGIGIIIGGPLGGAWVRRHSYYTLTNQRAFVAKDFPYVGRRLASYPIGPATEVLFEEASDGAASLYFATAERRNRRSNGRRKIGFEMISEGRKVLGLMRGLQRPGE